MSISFVFEIAGDLLPDTRYGVVVSADAPRISFLSGFDGIKNYTAREVFNLATDSSGQVVGRVVSEVGPLGFDFHSFYASNSTGDRADYYWEFAALCIPLIGDCDRYPGQLHISGEMASASTSGALGTWSLTAPVVAVPLPATGVLHAAGLLVLVGKQRRWQRISK